MCYTMDLTTQPNIDYQQYPQEEWKLNLFSHYLGVLYCCETGGREENCLRCGSQNQRTASV